MQQRFYKNGNCGIYKERIVEKVNSAGETYQEKESTRVELPYTVRCRICNRKLYTILKNGDVDVHTSYVSDELCQECGPYGEN